MSVRLKESGYWYRFLRHHSVDFNDEQRNRLAGIFDLISNQRAAKNDERLDELHDFVQENIALFAARLGYPVKAFDNALPVKNLQSCLRQFVVH